MAGSRKFIRLVGGPQPAREVPETIEVDSATLVHALRAGDSWAERAFLHRETAHIERILTRILGFQCELDDLTQEVFTRAFARIDELREPEALRGWLNAIAVFVAREAIRRKRRRRWLILLPVEKTPEVVVAPASAEARAALRVFYDIAATLDADIRIAFTLRCVDGMELSEIAEACDVSLATIKRRIKRGFVEFYARGSARPELAEWFEEGTRWRQIES